MSLKPPLFYAQARSGSEMRNINRTNPGVTIISLHIGGSARRGTLSDKFVPDALQAADAAIIVSEGDADGLL